VSARTPNVLLLFTDQQRADTIAALGNPVIKTPGLDRLCREGVASTNAFTPSPVCISARCSMIYGQYPHHTGCYENTRMPEDGRQSLMDALTNAGYRTHGIGKCHFSPDRHALRGFQTRERQEELVGRPDEDDYLTFLHEHGFAHVCDPHGIRSEMYYVPQPAQMPAHLHPSQWVGDRAVEFLSSPERRGQPWFLFCSFIDPHPPFAPPNPWHKLYRSPLMPLPKLPPDADSLLTFINRRQNRYKYRDQGIDRHLVRCIKAYYYATISFVDYQIGRVLDALARSGQGNDTLVVFASDHGELLGDYNCFGKRSMHDAPARVPLIARLPGCFEGGQVCDRPMSLVDIAPTVLGLTGSSITTHDTDGLDLREVAAGAAARDMVFSQHASGGLASYLAVSREWKYFYSAPDDREFLFDRIRDPGETRNLAGNGFCDADREQMKSALIEHLRAGGETAALDGGDWRRYPKQRVPENPDTGLLIQDQRWADVTIPGYTE
jgi:arylsulfatase